MGLTKKMKREKAADAAAVLKGLKRWTHSKKTAVEMSIHYFVNWTEVWVSTKINVNNGKGSLLCREKHGEKRLSGCLDYLPPD